MDSTADIPASLPDWIPGRRVSTAGRKKVVLAAGLMSRTGEALGRFAGFIRYLRDNFGFDEGDFLEVSYHSERDGAGWRPAPYDPSHCAASLDQGAFQAAVTLSWYRGLLPRATEYHLIGYSLGGVLLFEAASGLLETDPARWQRQLGSLITLSAPLFGSDLGLEGDLLGALGLDLLLPGGPGVRELINRGRSPSHRAAVERQARRLRDLGVNLLTLADAEDVVVTPEDAIIAPPHERDRFVLRGPRAPLGEPGANPLGHGPLLSNTLAWVRMAKVIGEQEPSAGYTEL